ncbi:F-box protein [Quillaja saponaria]|uniref:F-box protein n=1 Tax=Quillaja saponaria TaxID=32244 RepID=A0AAD7LBE5_QUISA|nr:F-box protein [Quillaja saponaria]
MQQIKSGPLPPLHLPGDVTEDILSRLPVKSLTRFRDGGIKFEVFTLRTNAWRAITPNVDVNFDGMCFFSPFGTGTYSNGALYWLMKNNGFIGVEDKLVLSFDLAKEKFHEVPLPPSRDDLKQRLELGVLGGSLCLGMTDEKEVDFEVWVLKDNINLEAETAPFWIKVASGLLGKKGDCIPFFMPPISSLMPLCFSKNGLEALMVSANLGLSVYNLNAGNSRTIFKSDIYLRDYTCGMSKFTALF